MNQLKLRFRSISYISATCDLWSRNNRSYIGVNVHYIDKSTGELNTIVIACERFHGSHEHKAIANKLKAIFARYGISKKMVAITTDNAGEFRCAMSRFGKNYSEYESISKDRDDDWIWFNDSMIGAATEGETHEYVRICDLRDENGIISSIDNLMESSDNDFVLHDILIPIDDDDDSHDVPLPSQIKCSAHTLNLLGKTDSFNALLDENYSTIYGRVFTKLNIIWSSSTSSRYNSEMFEKYLERKLIKPHKIRWNRIYDAVSVCVFKLLNLIRKIHA